MKVILSILSGFILLANTAFIQDKTTAIQHELIETIQKEYENWLINKKDYVEETKNLNLAPEDSLSITWDNTPTDVDYFPSCEFQDFKFKITSRQAVVQFNVNNMLKSAFLEKKDGKWKLVCCADLAPNL